MNRHSILLAGILAGLAAAEAATAQPATPLVDIDTSQAVNACLTPAQQRQPMSEFNAAQRRRLVACIFANTSRQVNAQLPVQVDELTRLDRTTTSGPLLTYHYTVARRRAELPANVATILEQGTRANVCAQSNMVQTLGLGGVYGYRWTDSAGLPIHQIQISRC